jgi:hypothetical protein
VKGSLTNKKNQDAFNEIVSSYVDRNIEKLSTIGPTKRIIFSDGDRNKVFNLIGLTASQIEIIVKKSPGIKENTNAGNPFNILMSLVIRFFKINKNQKYNSAAVLYLALSMYSSIHPKYFKYEPNEQIMAYTINSMSEKFKIKQTGNLLQAIVETAVKSDDHYSKNLVRGTDKDLVDYILSIKTRLNGFMKNIANAFFKQHEEKNYLNYETDNEDEDNFAQADSNSYLIMRMSDAVVMKLSVQGPNSAIITAAAKVNDVSVNNLRNTVEAICKDRKSRKEMHELVSAILHLYIFDSGNTKENIHSSQFMLYCMKIYKKANSQDENVVKIKKTMDDWIDRYSGDYKKHNAVGTVGFFRKAIFTFFVLSIQRTSI